QELTYRRPMSGPGQPLHIDAPGKLQHKWGLAVVAWSCPPGKVILEARRPPLLLIGDRPLRNLETSRAKCGIELPIHIRQFADCNSQRRAAVAAHPALHERQ